MSRGKKIRFAVQLGIAVVVLAALIVMLNPGRFGVAAERFPLVLIPAVLGLTAAFYILKGIRYHQLLRGEGVAITAPTSTVMTVAGEAVGLLPLGELARGELATEVSGAPIGSTVAAVTVQEMLYLVVIVAFALPGSLRYAAAVSAIGAALAVVAVTIAVLTIHPLFAAVLRLVRALPLIRRMAHQAEILQRQTVNLLRRADTWWGLWLSIAGAAIEVTLFWVMVQAVSPVRISWGVAAFVYGAAYLGGAVSSPGGLGGFEGSVVGLLSLYGVDPGAAAAAALLHRGADKGVITLTGIGTYIAVQRHFRRRRGILLGEEPAPPEPAYPGHADAVGRPAPAVGEPEKAGAGSRPTPPS